MTHKTLKRGEFRFTGTHMLLLFLGFFGVVVAVNITMAVFASQSWTGLVVKNSYVASQQFNGTLQDAAEQNAKGWHSTMSYGANTLALTLLDEDGSILVPDHLVAKIGRPAFEQSDQELAFVTLPNGINKIATNLAAGIWKIEVRGEINGETYRRDIRLRVSKSGNGKIL